MNLFLILQKIFKNMNKKIFFILKLIVVSLKATAHELWYIILCIIYMYNNFQE